MNPSSPSREAERLEALHRYAVLDTPAEAAYDDLTLLAMQICQAPIALVSLVDSQRQWFKSQHGFGAPETPRDIAFCAHTILQSGCVFEVPDALADPRFAGNPLVTSGPRIRFYAGAPLLTPAGHAVGALCVMDHAPRQLSAEQRTALQVLARHVVAQLELRRQFKQLEASEQVASRHLVIAEKSRRALLSVLEDEKLSGRKLRESEERFRQIAENINEVFWITDPAKQTMLYVSPAYEQIWGRTCASLYADARNWLDSIHPDDRARVRDAALERQVRGDYNECYRIVRPDGTERWIRDRAFPVRNQRGEVYRMVGTAEDITVHKQAELRMSLLHEVTVVLTEAGALPHVAHRILEIICRRMEWVVGGLWMERRGTKTLGCVEIWHEPDPAFLPFAEATLNLVLGMGEGLGGRVWLHRVPVWLPDATQDPDFARAGPAAAIGLRGAFAFPIVLREKVHGVVEFFSRSTRPPDKPLLEMFAGLGLQLGQFIERKQIEEQYRQAQKMEAIGTMAGGIAHDFNNVLAAINGYAELARFEAHDNAKLTEYLKEIGTGSARAADLVRQILAFSRLQEQKRSPIQLGPVVEEALKLLRATIPATITFHAEIPREGPTVLADATQIHQVLMNLATNAAHAMKDGPGRFEVILETVEVGPEWAECTPGLRSGRYQRLSVSDSGRGMDELTLSRIFDPFFTTKAPGEGTGLGLAVVHGIMRAHDGVITAYSNPGQGTRFLLYFPVHGDEIVEPLAGEDDAPPGRGESLLVVDDERPLALLEQRILQRLGYNVEMYTVPALALEAVRADPRRFDLVITDLTMPGMTGVSLAEHIRALRADLPVLLTTGYSATLTAEHLRTMGINDLLLKPITINTLGHAVRRALAETKPT